MIYPADSPEVTLQILLDDAGGGARNKQDVSRVKQVMRSAMCQI